MMNLNIIDGVNKLKDKISSKKNALLDKVSFKKKLDSRKESEKLNSLVFFSNEDVLSTLKSKGYTVILNDEYHILYSISDKITGYEKIQLRNFLDSGNILFIPFDFMESIELLGQSGEILISFTPGTGNQEIILDDSSLVFSIRRSEPKTNSKGVL